MGTSGRVFPSLLLLALVSPAHPAGPPLPRDPLPAGARVRLGAKRWRLWASLLMDDSRVVFSADHRLLASNDEQGTVSIYRTGNGHVQQRLRIDKRSLVPLAFSHDGRLLVTVDREWGVLRLWQTASGTEQHTLQVGLIDKEQIPSFRAAILPGGRELATWDGKRELTVWDLNTGKVHRTERCPSVDDSASFSPDGRLFCTRATGEALALTELKTGRWRRIRLRLIDSENGIQCTWSSDGRMLAVNSYSRQVTVFDTETGRRAVCLRVKGLPPPTAVAFSPDGRRLAIERVNRVEICDLASPGRRLALDTRHRSASPLDTFPNLLYRDEQHLLLIEPSGFVRTFDARTGKDLDQRIGHRADVTSVAFTVDGRMLASLGADGTLRCWDTLTGRQQRHIAVPEEPGGTLSLSGDGRRAALLGGLKQDVTMLDLPQGKVLWRLPGFRMKGLFGDGLFGSGTGGRPFVPIPPPCVLSSDGCFVNIPRLRNSPDRMTFRVERCQAATGLREQSLGIGQRHVLGYSPDGKLVLLPGNDHTSFGVEVVEMDTGKVAHRLVANAEDDEPGEGLVAFSPDSRLVGAVHGHAYLWERVSGRLLVKAPLPPDFQPSRLVVSPTGRIVVLGYQGTVGEALEGIGPWAVWDLQTRRIVRKTAPAPWNTQPALSSDGRLLALPQTDASILLYEVPLAGPKKGSPIGQDEAARLWADLASNDVQRAWRAREKLIASGQRAVGWLSRELIPATRKAPASLLADLDAEDFQVRAMASARLASALKNGDRTVEMALRDLLERKPSLEVHHRVTRLLQRYAPRAIRYTPDELRQIRAVAVLEHIGSGEAQALLKKLAGGAPSLLTAEARASLERLRIH